MKTTPRFCFAVAVTCALQTTFAQELNQRFVSPVGYAIGLPAGWKRIDKETLEKEFKVLSGSVPNARLLQEPVDGFQLESSQGEPGYPNITVTASKVGRVSFQDLKELASSHYNFQRGVDSAFAGNSFNASASFDSVSYDERGHFLRFTSTAVVPGFGRIRGITVIFPMDFGILAFQFFSTEGDYSQYAALFSRVIRSIEKTVPTTEGVGTPSAQPTKRLFTDEDFGLAPPRHPNPADSATPTPVSTAPGSQPVPPTASSGEKDDAIGLVLFACFVGSLVVLLLWLYFAPGSREAAAPPDSSPPVIEVASPPYTTQLHPSRLKDGSPSVIEAVPPATPNVPTRCSQTTHAFERLLDLPEVTPYTTTQGSQTTVVHAYFILQNDEPEGPYSLEELRSLWQAGSITCETFYCEEGYDEWLRLENIADQLQLSPPPPTQNHAFTPAAAEGGVLSEPSIPDIAAKSTSGASGRRRLADGITNWGLRLLMLGVLALLLSYSHLLTVVCGVGFGVLLLVGLPLAFVKPTRRFVAYGLFWWGCLAALDLVFVSFSTVSLLWGGAAAVAGVCLGIVGVIPLALLASLVNGEWFMFFLLLGYVILIHAAIIGGAALVPEVAPRLAGRRSAAENYVSERPSVGQTGLRPGALIAGTVTVVLLGAFGLTVWLTSEDRKVKVPNEAAGTHEVVGPLTDADVGLAPAPNAATTNRLTELETLAEKARDGAAVGEPAQPDTTATSGRIRVISPDGVKGTIPVDQLNVALRAGYQLLGGREQRTQGVVGVPIVAEKAPEGAAVTNKLAEVQALAEKGDAKFQFGLGVCYDEGKGVAQDKVEAVKWYRKAAEQNLAEAQYILGNSYDQGEGVERDYAEAVKWYRKAAEQNLATAQFSVGFYYANGRGVAKDDVEAVKWYRKAAEQNDATAQFSLGVCYDDGLGVVNDKGEAVKWYRRAAEQNEAQAQYNLGFHYLNGEGVIRNGVEAVKWFRKAAEQNDAKSQFGLGVCYANGEGVEKDYVEAYAWFNLAAKTKENAAKNRDDLEKIMSPEQVAAAQKRTKELRTQIEAKSKIGGPGHSAH